MLKQRVITAICLATVLLWIVFWWSRDGFAVMIGVVALISSWEWSRLCGLRSTAHRGPYAIVVGSISMLPLHFFVSDAHTLYIAGCGFVVWVCITAYC